MCKIRICEIVTCNRVKLRESGVDGNIILLGLVRLSMSDRHTPAGAQSALYKCKDCSLVCSFDRIEPIRECTACGNTTSDLGFSLIHDGASNAWWD